MPVQPRGMRRMATAVLLLVASAAAASDITATAGSAVLVTLAVLEQALRAAGVPVTAGGGVGAAQEAYQ